MVKSDNGSRWWIRQERPPVQKYCWPLKCQAKCGQDWRSGETSEWLQERLQKTQESWLLLPRGKKIWRQDGGMEHNTRKTQSPRGPSGTTGSSSPCVADPDPVGSETICRIRIRSGIRKKSFRIRAARTGNENETKLL